MQQRRLRLGDILDDYCPRERRITNHAVVAMIDDTVKQTRCTTCDAEHEYKQARVPAPRRRKDAGVLSEIVDGAPRAARADVREASAVNEVTDDSLDADLADPTDAASLDDEAEVVEIAADADADADAPALDEAPLDDSPLEDDGPVHRPLIRATLPRPEGQAPEWKEPDFTIRQPGRGREIDGNRNGQGPHGQRPGRHRRGRGGGQGQNAGAPRFGGQRQGPPRQGAGQGQQRQQGNRPGGQPGGPRGGNRSGGGRKRGR